MRIEDNWTRVHGGRFAHRPFRRHCPKPRIDPVRKLGKTEDELIPDADPGAFSRQVRRRTGGRTTARHMRPQSDYVGSEAAARHQMFESFPHEDAPPRLFPARIKVRKRDEVPFRPAPSPERIRK